MSEQATRYNAGKPPLSYLLTFPEALRGVARVCGYGEGKYDRFNYMKGAPASEHVDSLMRHLLAWWMGEELDAESGLHHLDHMAWNALRLADERHRGTWTKDNRPHVHARGPGKLGQLVVTANEDLAPPNSWHGDGYRIGDKHP